MIKVNASEFKYLNLLVEIVSLDLFNNIEHEFEVTVSCITEGIMFTDLSNKLDISVRLRDNKVIVEHDLNIKEFDDPTQIEKIADYIDDVLINNHGKIKVSGVPYRVDI